MSDPLPPWFEWRHMPGARWHLATIPGYGGRVLDGGTLLTDDGAFVHPDAACVPDWTDPATLGCLTQRARELRDEPHFRPSYGYSYELRAWCWTFRWDGEDYYRSTEYAALLAACDAAPRGGA